MNDYINHNPIILDEGLENKTEALSIGTDFLKSHVLVKVQSDDREFIEILLQYKKVHTKKRKFTVDEIVNIINTNTKLDGETFRTYFDN